LFKHSVQLFNFPNFKIFCKINISDKQGNKKKKKKKKNKIRPLSKFEMAPQIATEKVKFTGPEKLPGFKSRFARLSSKRKKHSSNFILSLDTS
jgi:hypothetical protein